MMKRKERIRKLSAVILVCGVITVTASGCSYVNNSGWDDLTAEEQEEVRQDFEEERRELEEEFSDDSAEYQFSQYILDKVEEGLEQGE